MVLVVSNETIAGGDGSGKVCKCLGKNENGWQGCCQPLCCYERSGRLVMAVPAAVRASTAVTTVGASTAVTAAVESAATA